MGLAPQDLEGCACACVHVRARSALFPPAGYSSKLHEKGGTVKCLPRELCRGHIYPIPHKNKQLFLTPLVKVYSSTWLPASLVGSIKSHVKNNITTLHTNPVK